MDEELLKALIKQLKKKGASKDFLNLLTVKEEGQIEELVEQASNSLVFQLDYEAIAKLPNVRPEIDKQISKAIKTNTKKLKETYNLVKKDDEDTFIDDDADDDKKSSSTKALEKKIADLTELVTSQTESQKKNKLKETAIELLKNNEVSEKFIKFFDFNSEDSLEDQMVEIKKDFDEMTEGATKKTTNNFPFPKDAKEKVTDAELEEYEKLL